MVLTRMQVTRIRCDPMFTSKFNGTSADYHPLAKLRFVLEHILTEWGYKDCTSSIDDGSTSFSDCPESMLQKCKALHCCIHQFLTMHL